MITKCSKIIFVSRWIQNKFFTGFLNSNYLDTEVIYPGIEKSKITKIKKYKNILFVGKLNKAKDMKYS